MKQHIAIVSATDLEIEPIRHHLRLNAPQIADNFFLLHDTGIRLIITGIGVMHTTYALMDFLAKENIDAWIQAGAGGAVDRSLEIAKVYVIESEMLYGFGAQDHHGSMINPFELGWWKSDQFPFTDERMICPFVPSLFTLPAASGMTTFHAHGLQSAIDMLHLSPHGQIENLEGAPFFFVSLMKKIPFLSLRSISNYVTPRNKDSWKMNEAIDQLNHELLTMLNDPSFLSRLTGK